MTTATAHETAVAAAFAARLPTAGAVTAVAASHSSGDTGDAVIARYAGEASAEIAVHLLDASVLIDGLDQAPLAERLRGPLEAAVNALGPGVLADVSSADASGIFAHAAVRAFDLQDETGRVLGRIAVRLTHVPASVDTSTRRLQRIAGVEMELTVEIGRTRMSIRDVLELEPGRIVELDRSAGAPADIRLNGRIIAHGEVVVVDQDYAVRITRIVESVEG